MSFAVILAAAGSSTRFGGTSRKKPFVDLCGRPVWKHSFECFVAHADVSQIIIVVSRADRDRFVTENASLMTSLDVVVGGDSRAESVGCGLAAVRNAEFVAVHDAARPFIDRSAIDRVFQVAAERGAAILASPVASTVKRGQNGSVAETVPRENLWLAQTPQVARRRWFDDAYADRDADAWRPSDPTDEAELLERCGHEVAIVESSARNFKITTQDDLQLAKALVDQSQVPTATP